MGVNYRLVATRLLGFALIGGCALLTILPDSDNERSQGGRSSNSKRR
jgi:hypothetical protein